MPNIEPSEPRRGLFSETNLKLLTAAIALVAVVVGLLNQHPKLYWFFVACASGVLVVLFWSWLQPKIKNRMALSSDRRFVASEIERLQRLYARFSIFVSENDGRSFRCLIRNASGHQMEVIEQIIGSDYITSWVHCYRNHLEMRPSSLLEFLKMSYEFTTIVAVFNRNYVIKAQQGIGRAALPEQQASHWLDELEKFREEFAHFLRDVEEWAHSVDEVAVKRIPNFYRHHVQTAPTQIFERVSSFRPKEPARSLTK